jgi:hypothetical protein
MCQHLRYLAIHKMYCKTTYPTIGLTRIGQMATLREQPNSNYRARHQSQTLMSEER